MDEPEPFDCPRCAVRVQERFYGPCRACRDTLRAEQSGDRRELGESRFEPQMHVTPNQVATKD